jgi:ribosomal protein S18 acetylase RimI-like enzyme
MTMRLEFATPLIRQAVAEDETAVRDCAEQAYVRYTGLIGRKAAPMTADFGMQILAGEVNAAFDRQGVFLGFIVFYPDERGMHIESVAVLPSAAGHGVGRALVCFCEHQAGVKMSRLCISARMRKSPRTCRFILEQMDRARHSYFGGNYCYLSDEVQ